MKKTGILIILIILLAAFLRLYRTSDFLGFWYDQGRDALVVWNIWHHHKFTLIGPTTGIEGIFLGPFYYYLLTPLYILGQGSPLIPAVGLVFINLLAIYLLYRLGEKYFSPTTGLIAAFIISISSNLAFSHRWLSNPTPLPLFSILTVWSLLKIVSSQKNISTWIILGLSIGISLQLEAASAIFFIPATILILLIFRKFIYFNYSNLLGLMISFGLTLIPQLIFDFRHQHLLFNAFKNFLFGQKSFIPQWSELLFDRLRFFYNSLTGIFITLSPLRLVFLIILVLMTKYSKYILKNIHAKVLLVWIITPLVGLTLYSGNHGYIWSYYLIGIYPLVILFVSDILSHYFSHSFKSAILVSIVILTITLDNASVFARELSAKYPKYITYSQSLAAIDWTFHDSSNQPFNYDVYVPPMIYSAYDYLYLFRGKYYYHRLPETKLVTRLYTLYEPDGEHQVLLNTWLTRQATIGSIEQTQKFGYVTVQRRHRFTTDL